MAVNRVPLLANTGIQLFFNGPESFTPDNRYLLGETPEVRGLFTACGFNSVGILSSGGVGKVLADWIHDGMPPVELVDVDVRRTVSFQTNKKYLLDRTTEALGAMYAMHWPNLQMETARGVRRSPFHDRLIAKGAWMTEINGYERPGFFGEPGERPEVRYSYHKPSWFEDVAAECRNTAENVSVFDLSCYVKFLVDGRDALQVLNDVCANDINVPVGQLVYTQWLNARGGIEADVTITRLSETSFMVVTIAASQRRDMAWLKRHIPDTLHAHAVDITSGTPMLAVMGPKSRELLQRVSPACFSNEAFPFGTSQEIDLGYAKVRASRVTFVGELGWELYMPAEFAQHVYDALFEAGTDLSIADAGFFALNSLRMEKGYRHWAHDIGEEDTPYEGGVGFAVALDKPGGFVGRDALLRQKEIGKLTKRLVQFRLKDPEGPFVFHNEPIWVGDRIVGDISSGAYGHRVKASLGMGYVHHDGGVDKEFLDSQRFEVEIACKRYDVDAQIGSWYDPKGLRIKI